MELDDLSALFKALSEPLRVRIIYLLMQSGELCVCDIVDSLDLSQAMVSRHLAYLRRKGLVQTRRGGIWVYYQLALEGSSELKNLYKFVREQAAAIAECQQDLQRLKACAAGCS